MPYVGLNWDFKDFNELWWGNVKINWAKVEKYTGYDVGSGGVNWLEELIATHSTD